MEPKAIRPIVESEKSIRDEQPVGTGAGVKKPEVTYEQRLEKMTNRQLRHEIKRGIRGDLTGYRSVVESVVLDVILKSFGEGMSPFIR